MDIILSISGGLIMLLLAIIAYFLKSIHNDFSDVKEDVSQMKLTINTLQVTNVAHAKEHKVIDDTLKDHTRAIQEHNDEIIKIKERII